MPALLRLARAAADAGWVAVVFPAWAATYGGVGVGGDLSAAPQPAAAVAAPSPSGERRVGG